MPPAHRKKRIARRQDPVVADSIPAPVPVDIPLPKAWKRGNDALEPITAVQTCFLDFNLATRVGGLPTGRIHTVHGATHGGKTAFVLGLVKSFLDGGHVAAYVDAEHSTPKEFAAQLLGDLETRRNFFGARPKSYEETIDAVDEMLSGVIAARKNNPALQSICVIDSITKLQPKRELAAVRKAGAEEIAKGHFGRARAALNKSWLDHLGPRLAEAGCAMVLIAQERDEASEDSSAWFNDNVRIVGGKSLGFDSSLLIRVSKGYPVRREPTDKKSTIIGFAHRVRIYKSKVGSLDGYYTDCVVHLSNGAESPAGFDLARDAVAVGKREGVISLAGSWLSWRKRRWQGDRKMVSTMAKDPAMLSDLMRDISARCPIAGGAR